MAAPKIVKRPCKPRAIPKLLCRCVIVHCLVIGLFRNGAQLLARAWPWKLEAKEVNARSRYTAQGVKHGRYDP
jgi:hypothetical protein